MHTVKLIHQRVLDAEEFAALKGTPAISVLLENRMRLSMPPTSSDNSNQNHFERSIRDWINTNCSSYAYMKRQTINGSVVLDVFFRSKTEAAGFKLYWADRSWE